MERTGDLMCYVNMLATTLEIQAPWRYQMFICSKYFKMKSRVRADFKGSLNISEAKRCVRVSKISSDENISTIKAAALSTRTDVKKTDNTKQH